MNRFARIAAFILIAGSCSMWLSASTIVVPSGTWATTGELSETRAGAAAVLLYDGVVLVTGGNGPAGPTASAERYGFSSGTFATTAPMLLARTNHTATVLQDGRVLVVGGVGADGTAVTGAEVYDPVTNAWQPAGTLVHARAGHTATLLPDGRVLVAGGQSSDGVLATLEVYSPVFEEFLLVASPMTSPRVRHAAALAGEKVLIAGGWDGADALASTDVYDPATDSVAAGSLMLAARADHSATTLLSGSVLVAGGENVQGELATAEVFDAALGEFVATSAMSAARSRHLAILLPHNNSVLIAGGSSGGAASATAELYRAWQDGGIFVSTGSALAARNSSAGSALSFAASSTNRSGPADGLVLVAGGDGASTAELYGFATVKTDRDDYSPGMMVRVSGGGWQPNQPVTLYLRELPAEHYARLFTIEADGSGNIAWTDLFEVEQHHLGVRFLLTAGDGVSQAQTTFTDGRAWTLSIAPTTVMGATTQFHTLTATNTGNASPPGNSNLEIGCVLVTVPADFTLLGVPTIVAAPDGISTWTITRSGQVIEAKANTDSNRLMIGNESVQFKIEATAPATGGSFEWSGVARNRINCSGTEYPPPSSGQPTVTVTPAVENQTITVTTPAPASADYGSSFVVAATGGASGNPVEITTTGVCTGGGDNSATITMTSGVGVCVVRYNQAGNAGYNAAPEVTSNTNAAKVSVTVTASSHNVTYGDSAPTVTASYAGFVNGETEAVLTTAPTCSTTYVDGSPVADSPYPTSCTGADATNYTFTYAPGSVTVLAAGITATASSHTVTYGDAVPTVTASYSGFVNGETDSVLTTAPVCTTTYVDGSSVAGSPYATSCSGAAAANYTFTYNSGSVTVQAAGVTVTASSHTVTYGDDAPTVTASYAGFVNGETDAVLTTAPTCTTTYVDGSSVAGSPYPTSCSGAAAANYTFTYAPGGVTVLAATVTVTASSHTVTYGDDAPTVTASYAGFVNGETETVLTTAATCTTTYVDGSSVGGSPYPTSCNGAAATNYTFTYTPGGVTVLAATVTVTASSHTVNYGDDAPVVTASYGGFVNGETETVLTTAATCSTTYVDGSSVAGSPYPTSCTGAAATNYTFTYTPGGVTVLAASVTVTASSHTVTYGDDAPVVTASYAGFVNGETSAVLAASPICATTYVDGSAVAGSPYPTTCTGAAAANYTFIYAPGGVNVLPATVTVTASSHTVTYGDNAPAVTPSFAGFVNSETPAVLTVAPVCSTVYVPGSPVAGSPYATSCGGATAANYLFSYTPGSLAVIKKALIITASSHTITFNDPVPAITASYSGFVLGENHTALTAQPVCSTTYTVGSLIGTYPSSCSSAASGNYQISYVGGTVTVLTACSAFNGFLSPIGGSVEHGTGGSFADPVRAFKLNSTIPVKFSATCFGAPLVSGVHTLQATKASNSTTYDTPIDATPTDAATAGNQFRLTGLEWHFNLSTKAGMSQGKWLLKATLFDGSSYSVWVEIKK